MKIDRAALLFMLLLILVLPAACTPAAQPEETAPPEEAAAPEETAPPEESTPEEDAAPEESETTPTEEPTEPPSPAESAVFTIQADEALQPALTALYKAVYDGEEPAFVDAEADLVATTSEDALAETSGDAEYFLPDAILMPAAEMPEVAEFIAFAISPDGQEVLIEEGELPATVTLTDQAGNVVEIPQPVRRVISSHGPTTFFLYGVGAEDLLVSAAYLGARDPVGKAALASIDPRSEEVGAHDYFTQEDFNVEEAARLDPDLIVASARTGWLDVAAELEIQTFLFEAETPERLKEAMQSAGQMFGPATAAQAEEWIRYYDDTFTSVVEQTSSLSDEERIRVLFTGTEPLRIASGDMYQTAMIEAAGGMSVSEELTGYWNNVNLEQIVIWEPDVIIVPPYGGATVEAITDSPEWQILEAVQEGRVYQMPKLVAPWDTPAPDSVLGIIWLAEKLYPDLEGLDCATETEYFYNTFYDYAISGEEVDALCQTN
jgi:iron complex transport system substrate-binding protein